MAGIVVGVDGSPSSRQAMAWAASEAEVRGTDLVVMQSWHEPIVDGPGAAACYEIDAVVDDAKHDLDAMASMAHHAHPTVDVACALVGGRPAQALVSRAEDADLLVVGSRGSGGFLGLDLGCISTKVARRSTVPVIVVRGEHDCAARDEVIVGVDGSACSRHALRWAADWANVHGKVLVVVMAWNFLEPQGPDGPQGIRPDYAPSDAEAALDAIVTEVLGPWSDHLLTKETVNDLPARAILERAANACLLVVGRHGTARWAPPEFGATALQVLHHAACPVAVIPEPAPVPEPVPDRS
jgi:nucleotide-binding universal stress UspA family protein